MATVYRSARDRLPLWVVILLSVVIFLVLCAACIGSVRWLQGRIFYPAEPLIEATVEITTLAATLPVVYTTPATTPTPYGEVAPPATTGDILSSSLNSLGFATRQEMLTYFSTTEISENEISQCPGEQNCIRMLHEKDTQDHIEPFYFCNNTPVVFDGWRAAGYGYDSQEGVPPGCWWVEGVTIRPWR